ncbi:hypothetical protein GCM10011390_41490 [Aureimonas endophytica]|uniref:Hemolysin XhlA n=1 Tax=Aureimonas endophytica TaxID=2027858 RepID=A0A916ZXI4_9HYPH|nr:hypothetical protein [Aureimonas endophytica]GGE18024.1 hypothetical protein GCM10011390_41490 [Aureimonas endophytica]
MQDNIDLLRKDHTALASSVSILVKEVSDLKIEKAVDVERDKNLQERLTRIEKSIDALRDIGKWALTSFVGALIAAIVTFVVKGGLSGGPPGT